MKQNFKLEINIAVTADDESQFVVIEKNLELLVEMATTLGLFTEGAIAELNSVKHTAKKVQIRRKRRTPAKKVTIN